MVEIAQPVFDAEGLLFILFAGPFHFDDDEVLDMVAERGPIWMADHEGLPRVAPEQLPLFRESLRQLIMDRGVNEAGVIGTSPAARRRAIERFLLRDLSRPLQLSDLAKRLNFSVDRCRHVVRDACGTGFAQLLRQMRLKLACSLLLNTDLTIDQVAARCGLTDPSGFTRAFSKAYGLSPGRWRKRNRG